ncbi:methyl-accepting chemotaxis sensory transducer [Methylobacterium nodulans ORS 2060]|uniref:Methyl-accepting chemotaxis sensory transducer n=1 Tax=Methylobacterium nodulans (strain LMG 21967 / CNCM I-2342 / ORS 2060) TaxID=460265 RepID=B8IMV3_METNO|nr:methyl-accepting chemotaxis sensory transducer [Methylobacterium nodulans ORS 2060]
MSISIGNRILLGFTAVILVILALGLYALAQIGEVRRSTDLIVSRDLAVMHQLEGIREGQRRMSDLHDEATTRFFLRALNREVPAKEEPTIGWRRAASATETALAGAITNVNEYRTQSQSAERAAAWQRIGEILTAAGVELRGIRTTTERQFQALDASDLATVQSAETALEQAKESFVRTMASAREALDEAIAAGQRRVGEVYEESRISTMAALATCVVMALAITGLIRRSVSRPLESVMAFVGRIGEGDLTGRIADASRDEFGRLGSVLNQMVEGLRQLASQNRAATANLNAAAAEIRASAQEQAASVEEQFAAVQETAATVDEITHAGAQIGKRAQEVIATAQATAQTSQAGLRAVDETARAMDAIREQSEAVAGNIVALSEKTQAIGEIIATVNDVSERTHLLALNAAIEAAAAGESGRSFAVVASEMKALADQAKESTAQVRALLGDIQRGINSSVMLTEEAVKRVALGKERSDTTHATIEEITARVQESVQTFQQIVASTNQQQLGIEQVMGALQNIRQASQQTAAGTRQVETAAANLSELATALTALAERYRL